MSNSESPYDNEPNTFDRESSDNQRDTNSEALGFNSAESEDAEVEVIKERAKVVPSIGRRSVRPTDGAVPLAVIPCDVNCASISQYCKFLMRDTQLPDRHASYHLEASTSSRGVAVAESSYRPVVTVVQQGNPRVPMGQPKELLFRVDYLEPNKLTEVELAKYRVEYQIPDFVKWRIPWPTESLSNPKDGKVAFFTDILKLGVWLPLQPPIRRILAHLGYALG